MGKRLIIDLTACDRCAECSVRCAYFHRPRDGPHGMQALRERAAFALVCRRCEEPSCVAACRFEALSRSPAGTMKRHGMRCVGCRCCAQACPFGVIYADTVPYYTGICDFCVTSAGVGSPPACTLSCAEGAVTWEDVGAPGSSDLECIGENLAVRAPVWQKEKV